MPNPIEEAMAKASGAARDVAARIKGLYGVFSTIAAQHGEARALLKRLESEDDADKQSDVWRKLRVELLSHERAELAEVFPELGRFPQLQDLVRRHGADATVLEDAIADVDAAAYGSEQWEAALSSLKDLLEHHIEEEEEEYFPRATDFIDKDAAAELDERFQAARKSFLVELQKGP